MSGSGGAGKTPWVGVLVVILGVGALGQWWAGHRQADVGRLVAQRAAPGDIQMLSSATCAICAEARLWFHRHGVRFEECIIETDAACAARFEAARAPGTPVIFVRGVAQLGFNPQRLADTLSR